MRLVTLFESVMGGGVFLERTWERFAPGAGFARSCLRCAGHRNFDARRLQCISAGSPAERAGSFRFLRAVADVVAVLLRGGARTRQQWTRHAGAMRRTPLLLRGAWAVAAI